MKKDYFLKISMSFIGIYFILMSIIGVGIDTGIASKITGNCHLIIIPDFVYKIIIPSSLIASLLMGIAFLMSPWVETGNQSKRSQPQ